MKLNRVLAALGTAVVFGLLTLPGNLMTAYGLLGFLDPKYRAWVMSEHTWTILATLAFLWLAFELRRDAGLGEKAHRYAKEAKDKVWIFEAEFRASMDGNQSELEAVMNAIKLETEGLQSLAYEIRAEHEVFKSKLERINETFMAEFQNIASKQARARIELVAEELRRNIKNEVIANVSRNDNQFYQFAKGNYNMLQAQVREIASRLDSINQSSSNSDVDEKH